MRPIFCGNFEYDARQSELERLFRRYGRVERIDMKSGFAFIYMEDEKDADDAIRGLDRTDFGRKGRRLRVEWTKHERGIRRPGASKRSSANTRPSKTLFVINFDPYHTRTRDLERHFEPHGKIESVRIRRNFAFVQYESQEDATRALDATNMSKLVDRVISVEYAARDDDDKRNGNSPDRGRERSPERRSYDRRGPPSPYRRERGSPDYGRGSSPGPYRKDIASPVYGRRRSPSPYTRDKASPDNGRRRSRSPYTRDKASPDNGRRCSRSPYTRDKASPDYGRRSSPSPYRKERVGTDDGRDINDSPYRRERASPDNGHGPIHSPYRKPKVSPKSGRRIRSPYEEERGSPDNARDRSRSPYGREAAGRSQSPYEREAARPPMAEPRDNSPNYVGTESPMPDRYPSQSQSPPAEADD